MDSRRQKTLLIDPGARARVWCKDCGAELTDTVSRQRPAPDTAGTTSTRSRSRDSDPVVSGTP